jgi:hypothetical protein
MTVSFMIWNERLETYQLATLHDGERVAFRGNSNQERFFESEYHHAGDILTLTKTDWGYNEAGEYYEYVTHFVCELDELTAIPKSWNGNTIYLPDWVGTTEGVLA